MSRNLTAGDIESMLRDLDAANHHLRDLDHHYERAYFLTDPARHAISRIKSKLLRASLGDVVVSATETKAA